MHVRSIEEFAEQGNHKLDSWPKTKMRGHLQRGDADRLRSRGLKMRLRPGPPI
jgi:hypothetical protein